MATGFRATATQRLSHVGHVVAPQRTSRRWLRGATLAFALAAAVAGGYSWRERAIPAPEVPAASALEVRALRDQIEQGRLVLRLSQARGTELERQIDTLNQQLAETQEQLTFFRNAREGRRPP